MNSVVGGALMKGKLYSNGMVPCSLSSNETSCRCALKDTRWAAKMYLSIQCFNVNMGYHFTSAFLSDKDTI